ncbi:acetate--CoA ligase family protein [Desulfatitalea alkaliphila]|uniref:Acetate--CoA ligase family protein n=1 Tax=Desulfatitalea alkaliphila TaxID=2929485 RepID=A0AA41UME0_9BACT|nr:acetate--CoA ligase [Desulfatitalea alkaliphila]MCJ8502516.1 acetate--CoA ligase family protein [Desulfatitalea alkaliphila]
MGLEKVMRPGSVAVVGASKSETKRGYQSIRTLLEGKYEGWIFPINPKEDYILGLRCHKSISEIEQPVDVALICTPAATVPKILEECGQKGVGGAVILAGGFRETGQSGRKLEEEIVEVARRHNIRLIGPNTSGMLNLVDSLNLVGLRDVPKGEIALLSQSGNMALSLITEAKLKSRKGFSYYVGVGNEADIRFHEYLEYFRSDPSTRAILMYVEGMRDGRSFLQQAYLTSQEKPIILLKSGRSTTGKKSAGSHTGALAGMSEVAKGAFERAGITVIDNSDELFPVAETLSSAPPIRNNQVAILADGGGHATIAADILTDHGIKLPELEEKTKERLRQILPAAASVVNPVDVAGGTDADPSLFADCAKIILQDANVGGLLLVGLFGGYGIRFAESLALKEEDAAHQMGKMVTKRHKPIVIHSLYNSERPHSLELCRYYNLPVYDSLDVACKCIAVLAEYGNYLKSYHAKTNFVFNWGAKAKPEGRAILAKAQAEGRNSLLEHEAKRLFQLHGAPVKPGRLAASEDEAVQAAREIDGPVVMKIVSPDILHKSDAGGVKLSLAGETDIRNAHAQILQNAKAFNSDADIRGVLVEPMIQEEGVEIIIGTKIDEQFGPVIMYGLGGIMVEILKDVAFRVLPISRLTARTMIEETLSAPILKGVRGTPPYDIKVLVNLLLMVSDIVEAYPDIEEMDINPVILHHKGASLADARIILKSGDAG